MKKTILLLALVTLTGCTFGRIDPGNVGIIVEMTGDDRGVLPKERGPGYYFYGPTTSVHEFPTWTQTYVWTNEEGEKDTRPEDERIKFSDKDGQEIGIDLGIKFVIEPGKAPLLFQTYRKGLDEITHLVLRTVVRDALNKAAAHRPVEAIYGQEKAAFVTEATELARAEMKGAGITIQQLYLIGAIKLPPSIQGTIQAKINATQLAQQKENELRQIKADAEKQIAAAEGAARSAVAQAEGDAKAKLLRAEAEAKANRLLAESFSGALLEKLRLEVQMEQVRKWNGSVPSIVTSDKGGGQILDLRAVAAK